MAGSIYVCGFLKLASLSKLIFDRFYIYVCVCVWIIKIDRLNTLIFGMHASINLYVDFTLIFDKFDRIYMYVDFYF